MIPAAAALAIVLSTQPAIIEARSYHRPRVIYRIKKPHRQIAPPMIAPPMIADLAPRKVKTIRILPMIAAGWSGVP